MPIGIIVDILAVFLGGLIGSFLSDVLSENMKQNLTQVFGFVALALSCNLCIKAQNMGAVALSVIVATIVGNALNFEKVVEKASLTVNKKLIKNVKSSFDVEQFTTVMVLFVFSSMGILGSMTESFTGDSSVLLCKSVLDFFTAVIFAANLGRIVCVIAIPQTLIFFLFFFLAKTLMPFIEGETYGDFQAAGGIITFMISLKILQACKTKPINSILGMIFIIPLSNLWQMIF